MKKIIILIPVYNDWQSTIKLLDEINLNIKDYKDILFDFIIINDASTIERPEIKKLKNFNSLKIINMKRNKGHARCNAFGLRYILYNYKFDNVILMDGDGEDRPIEIKSLISEILKDEKKSVVARRIKRSEGPFFQLLYKVHKIITFLATGKLVNFGNYSCLILKDIETIVSKKSIWSSFSGTFVKHIKNFNKIDSIRGSRYFGPSKMSFLNLIIHSLSIIGVFKYEVFLKSFFLILVLEFLKPYLGLFIILLQIFLLIFSILILIVSLREKEGELRSQDNLKNIEEIMH